MTVRIGSITLTGVQDLYTEEARALVEQRAPEQQGGVMQDLGREPLSLVVAGLLYSAEALADLERLRQAQVKGEPQRFAADIVVGSEITRVLVAEARIQQLAGYANRYRYVLRLREYNDPPQSRQVAQAKVQAKASTVGASRAADGVKAAALLRDPSGLPQALEKQPGLLKRLKAKDLASALGRGLSSLSSEQVVGILSAVASRDPSKLGAVFQSMLSSGQMGGLMAKLSDAGLDLQGILSGDSLAKMGALADGMQRVLNFLKRIPDWIDKLEVLAKKCAEVAGNAGPFADLWAVSEASSLHGPEDSASLALSVVGLIADISSWLNDLSKTMMKDATDIAKLVKVLKVQPPFRKAIELFKSSLSSFDSALEMLAGWCAQAEAALAGMEVLLSCLSGIGQQASEWIKDLDALFKTMAGVESLFSTVSEPILVACNQSQALSSAVQKIAKNDLPSSDSLLELRKTLEGLSQALSALLQQASSSKPAQAPNTS